MISPLAMVGGEFLYHIRTRSCKSVVNCENFTNFVVSWELCPRHNIFDESVFAFILNEKSGKFHN